MTYDEGMTKHEKRTESDNSFWDDEHTPFVREEPEKNRVYDLEERTARFGEAVIDFAKTIPQNPVTNRLIAQLVGAGTSVGANYVEADDFVSKKDFSKSIGTCRKEAPRNKAFSSHDCSCGARTEVASTRDVDGSQGAALDLLKNLERPKK